MKQAQEASWHEEIEHLREALVSSTSNHEDRKGLEKELEVAKSNLESAHARERRLEEKLELLENQFEEAMNATVANISHGNDKSSDENEILLHQLQAEQVWCPTGWIFL